jgi:hypothetical protein
MRALTVPIQEHEDGDLNKPMLLPDAKNATTKEIYFQLDSRPAFDIVRLGLQRCLYLLSLRNVDLTETALVQLLHDFPASVPLKSKKIR